MPTPPSDLVTLPGRLALPVAAAVLFVALAGYMRWTQQGVISAMKATDVDALAPARPVADVSRAVRAMKLVTVELDSVVSVSTKDESWLGDVLAEITVPVTLYYGTDLSRARVDVVSAGPLGTRYDIRIPEPRRIATEIYGEREKADVTAGWLRFKSIAGERYLGLARKMVSDQARRMVLRPDDAQLVRDQTKERIHELVQAVVGERVTINVEFDTTLAAAGDPLLLIPASAPLR